MKKAYVICGIVCAMLALFGGVFNNMAIMMIGAIPIIINAIAGLTLTLKR